MYSIGEISKMFDLPISTLRYYDKEGLFPHLKRVNGVRQFSENEIETLRIIDCLKRSGLEIKDIKEYNEDSWKEKYKNYHDKFNGIDDGHASQKVIDVIKKVSR